MGTTDAASMLLLLVAVATGIVALIVIYSRKRRQAQGTAEELWREAEEAQPKDDEACREEDQLQKPEEKRGQLEEELRRNAEEEQEQRREVEQEAMRRAEEDERQRRGAERRQIEEELRKAEEERHRAEEERKRLDEEARREMEEARRKTEVQRRTEELRKAEEERRKGEEEQKRHEADEAQRKAEEEAQRKSEEEEHLKGESEGRQVEPGKRGGRPRDSTQERKKQQGQETKSPRPKPEIGCWKRERQWILGVEVPEDLLEKPGLQVLQNWSPLTPDEGVEGCWLLEQANGDVIVRWNQDAADKETRLRLGEGNYLLFRLSGQNRNQGRCVKSPSSGWYLVTVPENCERDEALSGPPPVKPEPVSITGYRAHLFVLEKDGDGKIAFRIPGDKSVVIESKAPRFALAGTRLNDASEDRGPLFGQKPPQIHALDEQAWKDVETIVVGEEGSGKGRWRAAFSPVQGLIEQDLPSEVAARKGGWHFLRFYDTNDDLVDSLDFRFISVLKNIGVPQPPPLPPEGGHKPVRVEFHHERICAIQPADSISCSIQIERENDKTIMTIPPDSTCDETSWLVGPQAGPQVRVTVLVERLWWAVGEEDNEPSKWDNQILALSRDDFIATSIKALWLRLPRRGWTNGVFVGFKQSKLRPYPVMVTAKTMAIPLRDFGDSQELQDPGIVPFDLRISVQGTTYSRTLCQLKEQKLMHIVKVGCKFCDFVAPKEEDVFSHVKSLHVDEFFRPLNYEEMRAQIPSLPPAIYKCSYCDFYIKSDNPTNPTSTIIKHIENECGKVLHVGPVPIRFRSINNIDEIRENVFRDLLRIHKCKRCGIYLNETTHNQADMGRHLIKTHQNALYELR